MSLNETEKSPSYGNFLQTFSQTKNLQNFQSHLSNTDFFSNLEQMEGQYNFQKVFPAIMILNEHSQKSLGHSFRGERISPLIISIN